MSSIARHDNKTYQTTFKVVSALDRDVEVVAQELAAARSAVMCHRRSL